MPARRPGGKAASRKARQRNVPRAPRPAAPAVAPVPEPDVVAEAAGAAKAVPPVGTPDARAAVSLDPPRRRTAPMAASAGSGLSARERADYHYVERDLRNIAVLTGVMAILLLVAWLAFSTLGLVG